MGSRAIFWNFSIPLSFLSPLPPSFLLSLPLSPSFLFPPPSQFLFLSLRVPVLNSFSRYFILSPSLPSCLSLSRLLFPYSSLPLCPPLRVSPFFSFPLSLFPSLCRCRAARSYSAQGRCPDQQRCYAAATLAADRCYGCEQRGWAMSLCCFVVADKSPRCIDSVALLSRCRSVACSAAAATRCAPERYSRRAVQSHSPLISPLSRSAAVQSLRCSRLQRSVQFAAALESTASIRSRSRH